MAALQSIPGRTTAALFALAALLALSSRSAAVADPLACDDDRVLEQVRANLQNTGQNAEPPRKFSGLKETKEVRLGPPPRPVNQYATASTYVAVSRYCGGSATFETGEAEPVYWRLDRMKDGASESTIIEVCHRYWDQFEDGCKAFGAEAES